MKSFIAACISVTIYGCANSPHVPELQSDTSVQPTPAPRPDCTPNATTIPFKFRIAIGGNGDGFTTFHVEGDGRASYVFKFGHWWDGPWSDDWRRIDFVVPYDDLMALKNKVAELRIFDLKREYSEEGLCDGDVNYVDFESDGYAHKVVCHVQMPEAYARLKEYVRQQILTPLRKYESVAQPTTPQ